MGEGGGGGAKYEYKLAIDVITGRRWPEADTGKTSRGAKTWRGRADR